MCLREKSLYFNILWEIVEQSWGSAQSEETCEVLLHASPLNSCVSLKILPAWCFSEWSHTLLEARNRGAVKLTLKHTSCPHNHHLKPQVWYFGQQLQGRSFETVRTCQLWVNSLLDVTIHLQSVTVQPAAMKCSKLRKQRELFLSLTFLCFCFVSDALSLCGHCSKNTWSEV